MYDLDERLHNAANQLDQHAETVQPRSLDELDHRARRRDFIGDVGKAAAVLALVLAPLVAWQALRDRDDNTSVATREPDAAATSPSVPTPAASNSSMPAELDPTQTSIVESLPPATDPGFPATTDELTHEVVESLIIEVLNAHGVATDGGSYEGKDTNPIFAYFNVGSIELQVSNDWSWNTTDPAPVGTEPPSGEFTVGGAGLETPEGWLYRNDDDPDLARAAMIGAVATVQMSADAADASQATAEAIVTEISLKLNEHTGRTFDPTTVLTEHRGLNEMEAPVIPEFTVDQHDQITTMVDEVLGARGFTMQENIVDAPYAQLIFPGGSDDNTVQVVFEPEPLPAVPDSSPTSPTSLSEIDGTATTSAPENYEPSAGDGTVRFTSDGYIEGDRELGERNAVVQAQGFSVAVMADASRPADLIGDDDLLAIARELAARTTPLMQ